MYFSGDHLLTMLITLQRGVESGGASSAGNEDSDLERKRREAEALLQSVGITPDISHGKPAKQACSRFHRLLPHP